MPTRTYEMTARAESAAATREDILAATVALAYELEHVDFPLDQVAQRAGRSVQTILRQFGSRDGLFEAAIQRGAAEVAAERRPPDGDTDVALDLLVEHYELRGRFVLRLLAMGDQHGAQAVTGPGKLLHRGWVEDVFADVLAKAVDGTALVDRLVVVTDVHAWELLRLDRGLDPETVRRRLGEMVDAMIGAKR